MDILTEYEKVEIETYENVYYRGEKAKKKISPADLTNINQSFDDEDGCYKITPNDHIRYRYEVISYIGSGYYGSVVKGLDHKTNQYVAIKILRNDQEFCREGKHEVEMLEHIRDNLRKDNFIVKHKTSFRFRNHTCIVFDCLSSDVERELQKKNKGFDLCRGQKLSYCLIQAIHNIHACQLIHTDVKPNNMAFEKPGSNTIKLIDFGCSRRYIELPLQGYMQTRFYRAPEVILRLPFNEAIDIWSVGCTIYEIIMGQPLFRGKSEADMIVRMIEVLGLPPRKLVQTWINHSSHAANYFNSDGQPKYLATRYSHLWGANKGEPSSRDIRKLLEPCNSKLLVNFIVKCLQWNPVQRIIASQAIHHPWTVFKIIPTISDDLRIGATPYSSVDVSLISTAFKRRNCDVYNSVRRRIRHKHYKLLQAQHQDNQEFKVPQFIINLDPKRPKWRDNFEFEMQKFIPQPHPQD